MMRAKRAGGVRFGGIALGLLLTVNERSGPTGRTGVVYRVVPAE